MTFGDSLKNSRTKQPCLILDGSSPASISIYHLIIDGTIISLPEGITCLEAFDYLFQSHYVFDAEFDSDLDILWRFIENFFYKIEGKPFTGKMREVRALIFNKYAQIPN